MVARINTTQKLSSILDYNEQKVTQQQAQLIHANGFLNPHPDRITDQEKTQTFQRLNELNHRTSVNMLHITLSFDPSEHPSRETLVNIANDYLKAIGLSQQPCLVYQHHDTNNTHLHLVTNIIRSDGSRIPTHNIGRSRSEAARQQIELEYKLVKANTLTYQPKIVRAEDLQKIVPGDSRQTRAAMHTILETINREYRFDSFDAYNALLRQYNLFADRGNPGSKMHEKGGLIYRVLDDNGNKKNRGIKASSFPFKPTLARLHQKIEADKPVLQQELSRIQSRIDWVLHQSPVSLGGFHTAMRRQDIAVCLNNQNPGSPPSFIYVDNQLKTVFSQAGLGDHYTAEKLLSRISPRLLNQITEELTRHLKTKSLLPLSQLVKKQPTEENRLILRQRQKR